MKMGGVESIRNAVTSQLEMFAMTNPERFEKMAASYKHLIEQTTIINTKSGIVKAFMMKAISKW